MTKALEIEQLLIRREANGPVIASKSAGVSFELEEFSLRAVVAYGAEPFDGVAVFALPVNAKTVCVCTVTANRSLRFLFLTREAYRWVHDPFLIADRFPVKDAYETLAWPDEPLPVRFVGDLQNVLKNGDSPLLLGGAQALLDGVKLRLERSGPAAEVRSLWKLLPDAARRDLWPAEYANSTDLPFHVVALPRVEKPPPGVITEEQAKDYPAGRYEMALQLAIETGDQAGVNQLLARRSPWEMMKLALMMLAVAVTILIVLKFL